jgi:hypothetical protein
MARFMLALIVALLLAVAVRTYLHNIPTVPTANAYTPTSCRDFAVYLGIQGVVRGSVTMHLLGCNDSGNGTHAANGYYHATVTTNYYTNKCNTKARYYARQGWLNTPWHVAALVNWAIPYCTVYEDGSYSAGTYPN